MIYAVIPTGNRPTEYRNVYEWCIAHNVKPITIVTASTAKAYALGICLHPKEFNISKWWNMGLEYAYQYDAEYVYVLNDDVTLPDEWADRINEALSRGSSGASGRRSINCISGFAFGLNGKDKIYADDKLVWWYGDDDIQRQCEQAGGFTLIDHLYVDNAYANSTKDRFAVQIKKDRSYYEAKWLSNDR